MNYFFWIFKSSIVILRVICILSNIYNSFLLLISIWLYGVIRVCLSIHCWWTFQLFPFGVIINKAARNICVSMFVWTYTAISRSKEAGSYSRYIFNFLRNWPVVSKGGYAYTCPLEKYEHSGCSMPFPTFGTISMINFRNSNWRAVICNCDFNFYFPVFSIFPRAYLPSEYLLWWNIY